MKKLLLLLLTIFILFNFSCIFKKKESKNKTDEKKQSAEETKKDDKKVDEKGAEKKDEKKVEQKVYKTPVSTQKIVRGEFKVYVYTTGTVKPLRTISVKSEESGRIHFMKNWKDGEFIKKGEVIARLDDRDIKVEIENAKADVRINEESLSLATTNLEQSQLDYNTFKELYGKGLVSKRDLDQTKLKNTSNEISKKQVEIRLKSSRDNLVKAQRKLENIVIKSPINGLIISPDSLQSKTSVAIQNTSTIHNIEDQLIGIGTIICGVIDISKVILECDVTAKDIEAVQPDKSEAEILVYTKDNIKTTGIVNDISSIIDTNTKAFKVNVIVDNPNANLRPGMFAKVDLVVKRKLDAVAIPREIILRRNNRNIVFVVNKEEKAIENEVTLGLENRDMVEILSGLKEGDELVILGYETLQNNAQVKIMNIEKEKTEKQKEEKDKSATENTEKSKT